MIEINNLTEQKVNQKLIKESLEKVLKKEKKKGDLSIAFIGPARMRKLNKKYRKKNRVTDVLAFPNSSVEFKKFFIGDLKKTSDLGEIVVCLREVKKNCRKFNNKFEDELIKVLTHGLLHILGYSHEQM